MRKQILIVTSEFPPQPGGIGNHAYYLALYLSKNDYKVSVIADQRAVDTTEEQTFDAGLPFAVNRIGLKNVRLLMYFNRIVKTFQAFKQTDYVIATGKFSLWNVAFCSLFLKRYKMAVIHGTEVNFKSSFLRKSIDFSLKRFDTIVAVSNHTKSLVRHLNKEVRVIPNGINVSEWSNAQSQIKLIGRPILTTVGRVSTRKGQLNVIKKLPKLITHFPELHYHCVGIPTEADTFKEVAESLKVASSVTFHGSVDDDQLKQLLKATDIFVMLSKESVTGDIEGFGIAVLEANAMGIPAIGSEGCGIEDAIKPHYSGILIDVDNADQFVEAIAEILNERPKFKSEAISWAQTHDWDAIVKHYLSLLQ